MVTISLATPDDAYNIASVHHWSFQTNNVGPLISAKADPEELIRFNAGTRMKNVLSNMQKKPEADGITVRESAKDDHLSGQVIIVAKDDDTNEILGIAIWTLPPLDVHAKKNPFTRRDVSTRPAGLPEGVNWELMAHITGLLDDHCEYLNSKPYFYLADLAVAPAAQGKGVGRKLLEWGLSRAQADGTHAGLEATAQGYPVYIKLGFVEYAPPLHVIDDITLARMRWDPE